MFGIHWLGFIYLLTILFLIANFYYTLFRPRNLLYVLSHLLVIVSFTIFILLFVISDYTLSVVYYNSHHELPIYYRVAASWSNGGGSLLLFSTILSVIALAFWNLKSKATKSIFTLTVLSGLILAFINGAFESLDASIDSGLGLNPLLINPWVYPHPLATFLSYALIASSFALYFHNVYYSRVILGFAWATLSLALIFGGLWSYETLGWGGYWAWDPVEVIQLIPWLLITASMHSFALSHKLYGLFIASSLASVYYGFMVVRSGLSPIHGFASPQALTAYVCLASIALIAFASYMYFKEVNVKINGLYDLSLVLSIILTTYSSLILIGALLPSLLGSLTGLFSISAPAFDSAIRLYTPLLAPALILALAITPIAYTHSLLDPRLYIPLISGYFILITLGAIVVILKNYTYSPLSSLYINILIASLIIGSAYTSIILALSSILWATRRSFRRALQTLVHLFLVLAVIGIALSAPFAYNQGYYSTIRAELGLESNGLMVESISFKTESSTMNLSTIIARDNKLMETAKKLLEYTILYSTTYAEAVDEAKRTLLEVGVLDLADEGLHIESIEFKYPGGSILVRNATLKLRLSIMESIVLGVLEINGVLIGSMPDEVINLSPYLNIEVNNRTLIVYNILRIGDKLLVEGQVGNLKIPFTSNSTILKAYAIHQNNPQARELYYTLKTLKLDGITQSSCLPRLEACINIRIPRVLELNTLVNVEGVPAQVKLRYDIGGELAGVKGLVPRPIIVRSGLSDYYIAVYPKITQLTSRVTITDAELGYLSEVFKGKRFEEKIALASIFIASRLKSEVGDPRIIVDLNPIEYTLALLKLYNLTEEWSSPKELVLRVKTIPYIWILWFNAGLAVILQLILTITYGLRKR